MDGGLQVRAGTVVGGEDKIHPALAQQVLYALTVFLLIDGDGLAAVGAHHLHAGHIGEAVANVDHVGEGDALAVVGHGGVEGAVVGHIQHALIDAVDKLGLIGKVDIQLGPGGQTPGIIEKLAGVDLLKLVADAAALDDLPEAGGDDIVLNGYALALAEGVDAGKPVLHAGEELYVMAAANQKVPVQTDVLGPTLLDHGVHIGQKAVHVVIIAEVVGLFPEFSGLIAQGGNEGVVLHVGGAEGFVEIVEKGDDGLFHGGISFWGLFWGRGTDCHGRLAHWQ